MPSSTLGESPSTWAKWNWRSRGLTKFLLGKKYPTVSGSMYSSIVPLIKIEIYSFSVLLFSEFEVF